MADDVVPEGRVPLKSAIEQLREARQTNVSMSSEPRCDQAVISGSIVAQAMEQSIGHVRTHP